MGKRGPDATRLLAEAQRELELLRERCAELYDDAPVAYVTLDQSGIVRDVNLPGAGLLGMERSHIIGLPFRVFVAEPDRRKLAAHLARFRETTAAVTELRLNTRRAGGVGVELRSRRTAEAASLCFTAIINVSAQRRAEADKRRLEETERAAREASTAKDLFIASLSHELRSPLAPVLVALSSLKSGRLSEGERDRLLDIVRRNVVLEARLIDDLLDVTRIVSGKLRLERQVIDLHAVVADAVEMFSDDLASRGLVLTVEPGADRHHVEGDPLRLRQVFSNLIKNAIRFTPPKGAITIRSWNSEGGMTVEVADTGEGIEPEALDRIFNRFEQAGDTQRHRAGGLGLGLAISKGIVDLHRGSIVAHSRGPGWGTRVQVQLEAVQTPEAVETREDRLPAQRVPRDRHERILLVEDEADLAETLALLLQAEGFEVQHAATAGAALAVDLATVNLIITDLGLPDLDGRELLPRLLARQAVKAIALSGYGTEADIRASRDAGFLRHLTKPVEMEELLEAIDDALDSAVG